ncbi:ABC transporter ATP-binding protein [Ferrovibrio sp.]|uniref:ABC transporter ATP-binding protein n=1 Tax=Ferrovibrio sp. TaxID=1917215 RepID=UPI003D0DD3AA
MSILKARDLHVAIGENTILHGIDLEIAAGSLVAVVGANGAGKTTLLRAVSRLLPLRQGSLHFDGRDISAEPAHLLARSGLVQVPQGRQIITGLSVEDNLRIGAGSLGLQPAEIEQLLEREFQRFPVLKQRRGIPGGSLSGGEQQMLAVSRALMMKPKLLMLDEPSLGLAPQIVSLIFGALRELAAAGVTILLVEQVAFMALKIADHGYVLQNGRIALSGPAPDLLRDPKLIERYLG